MKGRTFNTANLPVCLIDFNYTRDTNTAKFDSYFRHFGESVIFVFRQTKSKFAHGEWRSLSANPYTTTHRQYHPLLTNHSFIQYRHLTYYSWPELQSASIWRKVISEELEKKGSTSMGDIRVCIDSLSYIP